MVRTVTPEQRRIAQDEYNAAVGSCVAEYDAWCITKENRTNLTETEYKKLLDAHQVATSKAHANMIKAEQNLKHLLKIE